jgi:endonuclease YncB( thermonuclease family)
MISFCIQLILLLGLLLPAQAMAENPLLETERIRSELFQRAENRKSSPTTNVPERAQFTGTVSRVTSPDSIWVRIDDRGDFRKWTYQLAKSGLNVSRQEVRVYLQYVSPKLSINRGKEYNEWFLKKAAFELGKAFNGRSVRVDYEMQDKLFRISGLVWSGSSSLNIWMVENGFSFYLLDEGVNPYEREFVEAEQTAKSRKVGLWDPQVQGN